jgi:DNA-binding LacI/PurR family transcriptional regulator
MKKDRLNLTLLIPHYQNMFSTFYTMEIIKEVSRQAIEQDVDLLIETAWKSPPGCGILFADIMGNEPWIKRARKEKVPYFILNYSAPASKDNTIGIDNEKAGFAAASYLIKAGHCRIATITGKLNAQAGVQRLEGFKNALKAQKINLDKKYIVTGDWSRESGRSAMKKLLSLKKLPTAVFVSGDEMALGAMEAVKEAGLKIPQDISFVGFDNIPQADLPGISLTTIQQPFSDLARLGLKYLSQIIKKKSKQPVKILLTNIKLIKRKSVREFSTR